MWGCSGVIVGDDDVSWNLVLCCLLMCVGGMVMCVGVFVGLVVVGFLDDFVLNVLECF